MTIGLPAAAPASVGDGNPQRGQDSFSMARKRNAFPDVAQAPEDGTKDRNFVVALARGLEILRCFEPRDGVLGNQEIAARTAIPKPTVSRLTYTLTRLGYLAYSQRLEKYQLAPGVLALGFSFLAGTGIRQIARPLMQELADRADAAVSLGVRDRLRMVYLEHCRGQGNLTLALEVGSRIPMATTAMGRAFLAALPEAERRYLMAHMQRRYGDAEWRDIRRGIDEALESFTEHGFCSSVHAWERDVNGVGVPLIIGHGEDIVAFNCGAPAFKLSRERLLREVGPALVATVRAIGERTGSGLAGHEPNRGTQA